MFLTPADPALPSVVLAILSNRGPEYYHGWPPPKKKRKPNIAHSENKAQRLPGPGGGATGKSFYVGLRMLCILGGPSAQLSNCLTILCATGALIKKQVFLWHQSDDDMAQVQDMIRLNHCCMSQNLGVNTSQDIKWVSDRNFYLKPGDPGLLPSEPYPGFTHLQCGQRVF